MINKRKTKIEKLTSSGANTSGGYEPDIVRASRNNDYEEVDNILLRDPAQINNQAADSKMSALHWASANRNLKISQRLYAQEEPRVDPWLKDIFGRLPVDLAIATANQSVIDLHHRAMFPENFREFDEFDATSNVRLLKPDYDPFA